MIKTAKCDDCENSNLLTYRGSRAPWIKDSFDAKFCPICGQIFSRCKMAADIAEWKPLTIDEYEYIGN